MMIGITQSVWEQPFSHFGQRHLHVVLLGYGTLAPTSGCYVLGTLYYE